MSALAELKLAVARLESRLETLVPEETPSAEVLRQQREVTDLVRAHRGTYPELSDLQFREAIEAGLS